MHVSFRCKMVYSRETAKEKCDDEESRYREREGFKGRHVDRSSRYRNVDESRILHHSRWKGYKAFQVRQ